jgi:hypothetical protein
MRFPYLKVLTGRVHCLFHGITDQFWHSGLIGQALEMLSFLDTAHILPARFQNKRLFFLRFTRPASRSIQRVSPFCSPTCRSASDKPVKAWHHKRRLLGYVLLSVHFKVKEVRGVRRKEPENFLIEDK